MEDTPVRQYEVDVLQVYEGVVKVKVLFTRLFSEQEESFMVPKTMIPIDVKTLITDGAIHFYIQTHNIYNVGTWEWSFREGAAETSVKDQDDQVEIIDTREEFTVLVKPTNTYETVEHPPHYNWMKDKGKDIECIDVIEEFESVNVAFAIKHLWRLGHKPNISMVEDLDKAIWYLQREKQRLSGEAE